MRVTLTRRLGQNRAGSVVEYDEATAGWLIGRGLAKAADPKAVDEVEAEAELGADEDDSASGDEVQVDSTDGIQVEVPPQSGKGSGREAWAAYARANGVEVGDDDGRDDIIEACEAAGVPVE